MDSKQLEGLGLSSEQVASILEWSSDTSSALKQASDALSERDNQITLLKSNQSDSEALLKQIAELKEVNTSASQKHLEQLNNERKMYSIKQALSGGENKPNDINILISQLDMGKVKLNEDGSIEGLQEQTANLHTTKPFLFANKGQDVDIKGVLVRGKTETIEDVKPVGPESGDFGKLLAKRFLNK